MRKFHMVLPFTIVWIEDEDGRILIGRHPHQEDKPYPGMWDMPGGKLKPHELPIECAIREAHEETGFVVEEAVVVDVHHNTGEDTTNALPGIGICYKVTVSGEFSPTELEEMGFVSKESLRDYEFTPWTRYFFREFL